jgi:hypothetical protein
MGLSMDEIDLPATRRKITQPLNGTVWAIIRFIALGVILAGLLAVIGNGSTGLFGFGLSSVCATVPTSGLTQTSSTRPLPPLAHGMSASASTVDLCAQHPTFGQRMLVTLTQAPEYLLWLSLLVLLLLLVRAVRRHGPFDLGVTRRVRFLAWFSLAASIVVTAAQAAAAAGFTVTADPSKLMSGTALVVQDTVDAVLGMNWIPLLLVVGGLLTLARIIRIGAQMHDDLAGTV